MLRHWIHAIGTARGQGRLSVGEAFSVPRGLFDVCSSVGAGAR